MSDVDSSSLYDRAGGLDAFVHLVDAFYAAVESDPVLRPLYPESLDAPKQRLGLFLAQYFGGPPFYSQLRGHPRLRMRHLQFPIGRRARDAWVSHMTAALYASAIEEPARSEMQAYFEDAATFLINQDA